MATSETIDSMTVLDTLKASKTINGSLIGDSRGRHRLKAVIKKSDRGHLDTQLVLKVMFDMRVIIRYFFDVMLRPLSLTLAIFLFSWPQMLP